MTTQGLSSMYPMRHPSNVSAREGVAKRIASRKHNKERKQKRPHSPVNVFTRGALDSNASERQ